MERPAASLGPFDLYEPIGKGGMGEVWRARHRAQGLPVAVKLLTTERARNAEFRASFRNEVRLVAGLDHPHIVRVFDAGEAEAPVGPIAEGTPYLAMELVEGGTLRRYKGRLPWGPLRQVIRGLLHALAHAHARGVIHRDIKPGNVLLSLPPAASGTSGARAAGGGVTVKLTDFGVAHTLDARPTDEADLGMLSGTPAYMAPEQFVGRWRDYGPWTDLYALGCLVWTLCTGEHLFGRKALEQRAIAHLRHPVPPLVSKVAVPDGFEAWLGRLLEKQPGQRFQRAADAAWALAELGSGPREGLSAGRTDPGSESSLGVSAGRMAFRTEVDDEDPATGEGPLQRPWYPTTWRRAEGPAASMELVGAGLGLFGLRPVPLVDREPERDALWEALRRAGADRRVQLVQLVGPPGCGKSRLASWMGERSHEAGASTVLRAVHGKVPGPGHGLGALLARFCNTQGLDRTEVRARVERVFRRRGLRDADDVDVVTGWLAPPSEEETQGGRSIAVGSATERYVVLERLLGALCEERPVVLWLDDVHHGLDALELVSWLLERDPPLPVLVLTTATDAGLAGAGLEAGLHDALARHPRTTRLSVGPLPERHRPELVQRMLGLEPALARQVVDASEGHPMYAVQLVGHWVGEGRLEPGPTGFRLRDGAEVALPGTMEQVWADRVARVLDRHTDREAKALEIAAVLGREVDPAEWRAVCATAGATPSEALVETLLDLRLAEAAEGGPTRGWSFVHPTLVDHLHERARERGRLRTLHRLCANLLADAGGPDAEERLGRHLLAAGDAHEALEPLLDGARKRRRTGDYGAAESLVALREQALTAIGAPESNPLWGEGWILRFHLELAHGRYDGAERWLGHLAAAARKHGWRRIGVEAEALGGRLAQLRGEYRSAVALLQKAEQDAGALHTREMLAEVRWWLAEALSESGELLNAELYARKALKDFLVFQDTGRCAACWQTMAEIKKLQGAKADAARLLRNALELYEEAGDRWGMASAHNSLGDVERYGGRFDAAVAHYERAGALFRAIGSASATIPEYNKALALLEQGEPARARPMLEHCLAEFGRQGRLGVQADAHLALAGCAAAARDPDAFDRHFEQARQLLRRTGASDEDTARLAERVAGLSEAAGDRSRGKRAWRLALEQWESLDRLQEAEAARIHLG